MNADRRFETPEQLFAACSKQWSQWLQGTRAAVLREMNRQFLLAWIDLATQCNRDPGRCFEMASRGSVGQMKLWLDFWSGGLSSKSEPGAARGKGDRRFAGQPWQSSPVFEYLKESYLLTADWITQLADATHFDGRDKQRLMFYVRQFIDAMSPGNFLATNPEAIKLAMETGGRSLLDGLENLLADIKQGHISMTDESAFKLGENLATTPGAVIFEDELMQVIQYQPRTEQVWERPLLVIPPFINKFYILDLQPENSFVKYALDQGSQVFLISWRNPGPEQRDVVWDDYIESVFTAIKVIKRTAAAKKVNAVGWCVGGTLLATVLAVMHARRKRPIASATFFTTLLDFSEPGELGVFIDDTLVEQRQVELEQTGILPGQDLAFVFSLLRANDLIWSYVVNNYLKGQQPPPFDVLYWNSDPTNLPAQLYISYVRDMYLDNKLVAPNALTMCDAAIDLRQITTPSYFLSAINDHIAPWRATAKTIDLFSGPVEFVLGGSGHIVGVINPPARHKRNYWINGRRDGSPEHWLETAESRPGSWWPHWSGWVRQFAGGLKEAPRRLGCKKHSVIEPAPGRYVGE